MSGEAPEAKQPDSSRRSGKRHESREPSSIRSQFHFGDMKPEGSASRWERARA
jgi:hypothetical protein